MTGKDTLSPLPVRRLGYSLPAASEMVTLRMTSFSSSTATTSAARTATQLEETSSVGAPASISASNSE